MKNKKLVSIMIACNIGINFMIPVYAENNTLDINFGELLTLQEQNGYAPFEGADMLENFYQAKAELPEEIPVLNSFEVSGANVFFVDDEGNDGAEGSQEAPLATVSEALNRISGLSQGERDGGSVIYLRDGEYHLSNALNITSSNTSDNASLFISAYDNENAVITANESVPLTLAQKVTKENTKLLTYSRINNNAIGRLYYISYEAMGFDKIPYDSVFYMNDMPMYVSRYPNQGTDTVESVIKDGSYINSEGFVRTGLPMEWKSQDEHPFTWNDTGNIHMFGRIANEWSLTDGIVWFDDNSRTVKSTSAITPNYSPVTTNFWGSISSTYYYSNIFEELDTFGEWFADDEAQRFYFYLSENTDINNTVINYRQHEGYAININGADNIVINDITISYVDNGININDSNNVVIQNCHINNIQSLAVRMNNTEKCGILNSDIRDIKSSYAVTVTQSSERTSELVPRRNFIQNSYIGNVSQAINISNSTGNIFSHNLIENTSYSAVNLSGAENIFEYNEFSSVANKITDAGGIYVGGDIKNRANTIRYNYFHDSRPDKKNARAIYNDDCSDMSWNYGNVVKNFSYGLFQHSGDDHVIMDNVVINAGTYIRNSADYAVQETIMKNYFFQSTPQFITGYVNNNLGSSTTWQTRYNGILKEKYEQVLSAKAGYDKDCDGIYQKIYNVITRKNVASDYANADDVQNCVDLVADTGCYYLNNTYVVPGSRYSNGYGPSNYGLYNVCEPDNGGKPYVIYLDEEDYDVSELVANMGLKDSNIREAEAPQIYMEQKKEFAIDEFTGVSWSESSNCSYYKAEFATDSNFENIVISYDTADNEYPVYRYTYDKENDVNVKNKTSDYEFLTDTPYFVRVTAVSLASCTDNSSDVSDTVEFILRDSLNNKKENIVAESYFGMTSMKIKLKGIVPDYLLNEQDKQITLVMYEDGSDLETLDSISYIAQINPQKDGSFDYIFSNGITDKTRIRVKAGADDITDEVFKSSTENVTEISFTSDLADINKIITAVANVNNMFGVTNRCKVIVAAYGEKGQLIGCKTTDSDEIALGETANISNTYTVPEGTKSAKAFIWNEVDMKPLAEAIH